MKEAHAGLRVHVPFKRVLCKGERVEIGWFEDLGHPGLDPTGPGRVEPHYLGDEVAFGLVLGQGEGGVSDVRYGGPGPHVHEEGDVWGGAVLEYLAFEGVMRGVVNIHLYTIRINS